MGIRCADHVTPLYPQKLALTSPTGGGLSVGIVRLRTKATELYNFRCWRVIICHFPAVEELYLFNYLLQSIFLLQGCKNPGRYRGADKSLARPGRNQATATKLPFASHSKKKNQKFVRPSRSPRQENDLRVRGKMATIQFFFNRVGLRTYQHPCRSPSWLNCVWWWLILVGSNMDLTPWSPLWPQKHLSWPLAFLKNCVHSSSITLDTPTKKTIKITNFVNCISSNPLTHWGRGF